MKPDEIAEIGISEFSAGAALAALVLAVSAYLIPLFF